MRVLITGCGGFVGKHLCRFFQTQPESGDEIYAGVYSEEEARSVMETTGLPAARILQADITDKEAVRQMTETAAPHRVVHLAAQASVALSFQEPELTMRINADGTRYLLEALRDVSPTARVLLVGSIDQYGYVEPDSQPIPETCPLTGVSPYGESKRRQEALALQHVRRYGQQIILARSAPHIGRGQSRRFAVADWVAQIREMKRGERPRMLTVGNLEAVRDISDVRDVTRAYGMLLEKGVPGEVYNVGAGRGVKMAEIPPLLGKLAGIPDLEIHVDPDRLRPSDIPVLVPDVKKLISHTGWRPRYTLEQTLAWMLEVMV